MKKKTIVVNWRKTSEIYEEKYRSYRDSISALVLLLLFAVSLFIIEIIGITWLMLLKI